MKSLDTNVLYHATNRRAEGHAEALRLVEGIAAEPLEWIIADQVLFEYYRLIRDPAVLAAPLSAAEAGRRLGFFREQLGCPHCAYEPRLFGQVLACLQSPGFSAARTFDAVLAVTLKHNGVDTFYTRNVRDFRPFGWFTVIDPLA